MQQSMLCFLILNDQVVPLKRYIQKIERRYIGKVLQEMHGDKSKTALALGISRTSLYEKIKGEMLNS